MEFYISPQSGQFYMINVLENQWLSVTYKRIGIWFSVNKTMKVTTFWYIKGKFMLYAQGGYKN